MVLVVVFFDMDPERHLGKAYYLPIFDLPIPYLGFGRRSEAQN
jgi:hypothetical protein